MKANSNPMVGTSTGTVGGLGGEGAMRPAPKKVTTPHNRFFWWFSLSLLFLGPFGFVIGPLLARRGLRKAERLYPQEAYAAQQRDQGFSWGQWWVMTPLALMMGMAAIALLKWLPVALLVTWEQLAR
ncbi:MULTISPECIES: hypothetical protein [Xanthomonas]|uniref:hypothetical protein n=1 Tax=Xanthomonas TaxID=338 RepID=UPI002B229EB6|nr:hypothetical protein [Xanthomonas campestris]MEA9761793.1 hypothetical protein [Xanthomonas campestris pv. raphani]MEA9814002.1 hypothetical protein [Xanthomonas campestris pv. raphani]MEA9907103.1 hypothetical protein [Xanthomonas campestris pv. raphani]MEA9923400.1 hypothetical protein [Xanthomonas campestris pv. raphani]MEA9935791.1 hypothetical protein [Xanthomonas campestris pv. raphani]